MKIFKLFGIDLRLFDGAAGAGATGGEGGATSADTSTGNTATTKAESKKVGGSRQRGTGELSNVVYGKQAETTAENNDSAAESTASKKTPEVSTTSNTLEEKRAAFDELINGEYKDLFTEKTQGIIDRRFKQTKMLESQLKAQEPIIDALMGKYKIDDRDIGKLGKAIESDDAYWEEAAEAEGLTVEQYKTMQKLKKENEELVRAEKRRVGEAQAQTQVNEWIRQADEVVKVYPEFNFEAELKNPQFKGLLKANIPVQLAYEVLHKDEMITGAAKVAAQQAEQQTINRIKNKAARPTENGISSQGASIIKSDVSSLTKADRAEIARRVARGEKITF